MAVKVTYGYNPTQTGDRRYSIVESYWLPNVTDLTGGPGGATDNACIALANARLGLCAANIQLQSIRQSLFTLDPSGRPIAARQRNRIIVPGQAQSSGRTVSSSALQVSGAFSLLNSDQPKAAVLCFLDGQAPNQGVSNVGTLYLAGIPDDIIQMGANGTPAVNAVAGWSNAWTSFLGVLNKNGFAFLGTMRPPTTGPVPILRWANEAAGSFRLMFTISANLFTVGQKIHVRGVRMNAPRTPTPMGKWKIDAVAGPDASNNYTYTLKNSQGFTSSQIVTDGTVESDTKTFYSYLGTGTPMRATTRKRGATYGAARGRSRPRPRPLV